MLFIVNTNLGPVWTKDNKEHISKMKFTYDGTGKLNSKSEWWQEKDIWLTEYYKILLNIIRYCSGVLYSLNALIKRLTDEHFNRNKTTNFKRSKL